MYYKQDSCRQENSFLNQHNRTGKSKQEDNKQVAYEAYSCDTFGGSEYGISPPRLLLLMSLPNFQITQSKQLSLEKNESI